MGNPSIARQAAQQPAEMVSTAHNGLLAFVPGDLVAAAAATLPQPSATGPQELAADVQTPRGLFRIAYRVNSYKHGRSRHWHWLAVLRRRRAQSPG